MKLTHFFMSPYLLITAFLLVLISGEHWGGFYLIYLLLALPHGGIHALLGTGGILCLVLGHNIPLRHGGKKLLVAIVGIILLVGSLFFFFYNDKSGYNDGTFEQAIPLLTFVIAGALAMIYLILNVIQYLNTHKPNGTLAANRQQ